MNVPATRTPYSFSPAKKPFAWSWSKLEAFEVCPSRHNHLNILKDFSEHRAGERNIGREIHDALAKRLEKKVPLPEEFAKYESAVQRVLTPEGNYTLHVEKKLALKKDFSPCEFFDNNAWFRSVADFIKISGPVALLGDWKSGKIKEDSQQLAISAICVFAHYPNIEAIRSEFIWLKYDHFPTSRVDIRRSDIPQIWRDMWPRIEALEQAYDTGEYPAKPGGLCRKYCPVKSCPHHGG